MATDTVMAPVHPGEILLEEFLKPLDVSQYKLAKEIGVPARGARARACSEYRPRCRPISPAAPFGVDPSCSPRTSGRDAAPRSSPDAPSALAANS